MRSVFVFIGLYDHLPKWTDYFVTSRSKLIEDILFQAFYQANGLPSDVVKYVMQDNQGYIWIGTDNGLVRSDGQHMICFQQS